MDGTGTDVEVLAAASTSRPIGLLSPEAKAYRPGAQRLGNPSPSRHAAHATHPDVDLVLPGTMAVVHEDTKQLVTDGAFGEA